MQLISYFLIIYSPNCQISLQLNNRKYSLAILLTVTHEKSDFMNFKIIFSD